MILTGSEIVRRRQQGDLVIEPFDSRLVEPNSYGVHLGNNLIVYTGGLLDSYQLRDTQLISIPEEGYALEPDKFYLGHTMEKIGGVTVTSELYANRSTASTGIFIQSSAPLGHVGAVIRWTLELVVAQPVIVYPGMLIGKVCFWTNHGEIAGYEGRYAGSEGVVASRMERD